MRLGQTVVCVATLALSAAALAAQDERHQDHHAVDTTPPSFVSEAIPGRNAQKLASLREQLSAMQDMHQRMTEADKPEVRRALMAEHMSVMQHALATMRPIESSPPPTNLLDRQELFEARMDAMQALMDLMMDRFRLESK